MNWNSAETLLAALATVLAVYALVRCWHEFRSLPGPKPRVVGAMLATMIGFTALVVIMLATSAMITAGVSEQYDDVRYVFRWASRLLVLEMALSKIWWVRGRG